MSDFKSPTTLTQSQFASIARVDLVEWSDPAFQCQTPTVRDYFTGLLYGTIVEDSISVNLPGIQANMFGQTTDLATVVIPTILSGTLETSAAYQEIEIISILNIEHPTILDSTLEGTVTYRNTEVTDQMTVLMPVINPSSLLVVVAYITHEIQPEKINLSLPTITSGTLL